MKKPEVTIIPYEGCLRLSFLLMERDDYQLNITVHIKNLQVLQKIK